MSNQGLDVARRFGMELPSFSSQEAAEAGLLKFRDDALRALQAVIALDYSPESLKTLESWFFSQPEPRTFPNGAPLELAIGFYVGEVFCRHIGFSWVVQPFAFSTGKYEVGVNRGGATITVTKGWPLSPDGNKRMQSMWREYRKFAELGGYR